MAKRLPDIHTGFPHFATRLRAPSRPAPAVPDAMRVPVPESSRR